MATLAAAPASTSPVARGSSAVLTAGCDGYLAGTVGVATGRRQGCVVFVPDQPERVARWARPRTSLLVPPALVAAWR